MEKRYRNKIIIIIIIMAHISYGPMCQQHEILENAHA